MAKINEFELKNLEMKIELHPNLRMNYKIKKSNPLISIFRKPSYLSQSTLEKKEELWEIDIYLPSYSYIENNSKLPSYLLGMDYLGHCIYPETVALIWSGNSTKLLEMQKKLFEEKPSSYEMNNTKFYDKMWKELFDGSENLSTVEAFCDAGTDNSALLTEIITFIKKGYPKEKIREFIEKKYKLEGELYAMPRYIISQIGKPNYK